MHFPTLVAIFSLPTFTAAVSIPRKLESLSPPNLNATSLDVRPDRRFRITRVYSGEEVVKNDCLVVGFWLVGQLATKDWSSNIPFARGPHLANFPGVHINIDPQELLSDLPIRHAIWGLKLTMLDLLARDQFVESIYELHWNYLTVGTVYIQHVPDPSTPQSLGGKVGNQSLTLPLAVTQGVNIAIQPIPGAQAINPRDIWITMFESQERLAYPEAHLIPRTIFQLGPFLPSSKAFFNVDPLHGHDLPRLYPPFLHVSTVCYALMLIAIWMCQNDRFDDFGFTIFLGGTLVGGGRLGQLRTHGLPLPSSGLAGNISTS